MGRSTMTTHPTGFPVTSRLFIGQPRNIAATPAQTAQEAAEIVEQGGTAWVPTEDDAREAMELLGSDPEHTEWALNYADHDQC
jgi:hypothetical protein